MNTNEIQKLIEEIINKILGFSGEVSLVENYLKDKEKALSFSVSLKDPYHFTKNDGEGLIALNHIIRKIIENKIKEKEEMLEVMIDINDFQKKKIENIKALAYMMAERSRYFKSKIEFEPMSSYERRIVHEFLSGATDLQTESEGFGKERRVIIKYIGKI